MTEIKVSGSRKLRDWRLALIADGPGETATVNGKSGRQQLFQPGPACLEARTAPGLAKQNASQETIGGVDVQRGVESHAEECERILF
jgi:hypothetical protein